MIDPIAERIATIRHGGFELELDGDRVYWIKPRGKAEPMPDYHERWLNENLAAVRTFLVFDGDPLAKVNARDDVDMGRFEAYAAAIRADALAWLTEDRTPTLTIPALLLELEGGA